jgi:hypothetical protein
VIAVQDVPVVARVAAGSIAFVAVAVLMVVVFVAPWLSRGHSDPAEVDVEETVPARPVLRDNTRRDGQGVDVTDGGPR